MIKISNLSVKVEDKQILDNLNLEIKPGEVVAVMGPNGSGKSTLAYSLAGHPKYEIANSSGIASSQKEKAPRNDVEGKNSNGIASNPLKAGSRNDVSRIEVDGVDITEMTPDERAGAGVFLANQYPVAIPGLTVSSFLWQIYKKRTKNLVTSNKKGEEKRTSLAEFKEWIEKQAKALDLKPELLSRGLNDGFSGGEKKKLEILQLLVFRPKYVILDEIDSGLDVDALKKIANTMAKVSKEMNIGVLVITHYNRILKYLKPDKVVILEKGVVKQTGDHKLALKIEKSGYNGQIR